MLTLLASWLENHVMAWSSSLGLRGLYSQSPFAEGEGGPKTIRLQAESPGRDSRGGRGAGAGRVGGSSAVAVAGGVGDRSDGSSDVDDVVSLLRGALILITLLVVILTTLVLGAASGRGGTGVGTSDVDSAGGLGLSDGDSGSNRAVTLGAALTASLTAALTTFGAVGTGLDRLNSDVAGAGGSLGGGGGGLTALAAAVAGSVGGDRLPRGVSGLDGRDKNRLGARRSDSHAQDLGGDTNTGVSSGVAASRLDSASAAGNEAAVVASNNGAGDGSGLSDGADRGGELNDLSNDGGAIAMDGAVGDGGSARGDGLGGGDIDRQGGGGSLSGIGGGVIPAEVLVELAGVVVGSGGQAAEEAESNGG
jgi:hypothetical protein